MVNSNFDTGVMTSPCDYKLVDDAYKQLLLRLPSQAVEQVNDQLRKNMLAFYKTVKPDAKNDKEEEQCAEAIAWLKTGK